MGDTCRTEMRDEWDEVLWILKKKDKDTFIYNTEQSISTISKGCQRL